MSIYAILASKPHNPHYLNRYIRFIERCRIVNENYTGYTEKHHICPRADDMFPEYENFQLNHWNLIKLTPRQHFIAHLILAKAFPIKSQTFALWSMINIKNFKINSRIYENLKTKRSKYLSEYMMDFWSNLTSEERNDHRIKVSNVAKNKVLCKDEYGNIIKVAKEVFDASPNLVGHTKGKVTVKDKQGNFYSVDVEDERIKSGELVGINKGKKLSTEEREKLSKSRKGIKKPHLEKFYKLIDPDGKEIYIKGITKFCKENNLSVKSIISVAKGKLKHHKGWKCRRSSEQEYNLAYSNRQEYNFQISPGFTTEL